MKLLFIGFGNVGRKIAEIFSVEKEKYPKLKEYDPKIIGMFTKNHGAVVNESGINLPEALSNYNYGSLNPESKEENISSLEAVKNLDYDVLVELSTLSIKDMGEPAVSHVREALMRGRHVVTANKGPAAFAHKELTELASKNNKKFLFESAVMDGAPVFSMARCSMKGCRVTGFSGILNSTTNFILSQLECGRSFDDALKIAQEEGFAEADPSNDIEGWDAAAKVAVLSNELMGAGITPFDVYREGVAGVTLEKTKEVKKSGKRLKLVCGANYDDGKLVPYVRLQELPWDHPFAKVDLSGSILRVETDLMNPVLIIQDDPDIYDTAYGVINDLLTINDGVS